MTVAVTLTTCISTYISNTNSRRDYNVISSIRANLFSITLYSTVEFLYILKQDQEILIRILSWNIVEKNQPTQSG